MKTFFTADTHFDHDKLIDNKMVRPFNGIDEWNATMLNGINSLVKRRDRLFIIGDFAWKRLSYWRQQIQCRHVTLILGNHDHEKKCRNIFGNNLYITRTIKMLGTRVFLSHFPHAFWDGSHRGWLHLYGHCHNQREVWLDSCWPTRRSMDVSPDSAFKLFGEWRVFSDKEVYTRLTERDGHDTLDFYKTFQANLKQELGIE